MAELEGADRALAFTSGMAALAAVTKLVVMGEHIVAGDDIYGGTSRLLAQVGCSSGARKARWSSLTLGMTGEGVWPIHHLYRLGGQVCAAPPVGFPVCCSNDSIIPGILMMATLT